MIKEQRLALIADGLKEFSIKRWRPNFEEVELITMKRVYM
jgi:hypothetical protein